MLSSRASSPPASTGIPAWNARRPSSSLFFSAGSAAARHRNSRSAGPYWAASHNNNIVRRRSGDLPLKLVDQPRIAFQENDGLFHQGDKNYDPRCRKAGYDEKRTMYRDTSSRLISGRPGPGWRFPRFPMELKPQYFGQDGEGGNWKGYSALPGRKTGAAYLH